MSRVGSASAPAQKGRGLMLALFSVVAAVGAFAPSACTRQTAPAGPPPEKTNLVAAVVPAVDSAGFYVAQQQGFFTQEGLNVKIVPSISSKTVLAAQMRGTYDVTVGNYVSYVQAEVGGAKLRIIDEGSVMRPQSQVILVLRNSPIRTVADLRGKKIGVNAPNNIGTLLVNALLTDHGMSQADVHFVVIPFPKMADALKNHIVDAAWLPEPFATNAEEHLGALPLADLDQGSVGSLPISGVVVTQAWAHRYPNNLAALQRALNRGQVYASQHRSAIEQAMEEYAGLGPREAALIAIDAYPTGIDEIRLKRIPTLMTQYSMLSRPFDIGVMLGG